MIVKNFRNEQACKPQSYACLKLQLTERLTGVKCRATSEAKKWAKDFGKVDNHFWHGENIDNAKKKTLNSGIEWGPVHDEIELLK